jgi:hypothetical protein
MTAVTMKRLAKEMAANQMKRLLIFMGLLACKEVTGVFL